RAPRRIIEKMYGEGVFYEEAINIAYPDAYSAAVLEAGITPVDRAEVELVDINNEGFIFTATVTVKPEVTLGQYKGLAVERPVVSVTDADVDDEIERLRQRAGRVETAERPAELGDTVIIDFEGFVDDVPFEGGKADGFNLKLGSGQFIPGFEDQLVGLAAGDEKDVSVTFPEEYHAEDLAGKPAVFKVKVQEVKETILPDVDDELAKDISEFETLEELKADIRAKQLENRQKAADDETEGRLIDKMLEGMQAEVPEVMIEHQLDHIQEDFAYRLRAQGMTLESYLQMTGMDMESFRKTFYPQAERQVKTRLALEAVIEAEGFTATEEDIEAEYQNISEKYKTPLEDVKKYMSPEAVKEDLLNGRAIALIKETALITDEKPAEEESVNETAEESKE
ncbi:MAG TPA: trigger factor, partial [Clostridiales bacterium]|nr:trigger factor [Clostridiales bacterium]